jgi:hypothetical protein
MFDTIRIDVSERMAEVTRLLDVIRMLEATPPEIDPVDAKVVRGLFHVQLYAVLEFAVNQGVRAFLTQIKALEVKGGHMAPQFHTVALEPIFSSLRNVGEEKRWPKRLELIGTQSCPDVLPVNVDIFGMYLQNVWAERLDTVFQCLCIDEPIVPDPSYRYLVERRNSVAHGRQGCAEIGSRARSDELQKRLNAISLTCLHILRCLEQHHELRAIVQPSYRSAYN